MNLKNSLCKINADRTFVKEITVPTSKSLANRLLILGSLIPEEVKIYGLPKSTDVLTMLDCLKQLGLEIEELNDGIAIKNSFPACENSEDRIVYLKTGDGGTTNRFIIPLLALGKNTYFLEASHKMLERPMDEMVVCLKGLQVDIEQNFDNPKEWLKVKGPIIHHGGQVDIDAGRSTQFASGMRMAFWNNPNMVSPVNLSTSSDYYYMTESLCLLAQKGQREFSVSADFSGASYPMALAALFGDVLINNIKWIDNSQADSFFVELLKESGAGVELTEKGLRIFTKENLRPLTVSCEKFPDLILTLAFYLSYVDGVSELKNLKVLRLKESDRLFELLKLLKIFQVNHRYDEALDVLRIDGSSKYTLPHEVEVCPPPDHRVIMVSYLFLRRNSGGILHSVHHVDKSFPDFFTVMNS